MASISLPLEDAAQRDSTVVARAALTGAAAGAAHAVPSVVVGDAAQLQLQEKRRQDQIEINLEKHQPLWPTWPLWSL